MPHTNYPESTGGLMRTRSRGRAARGTKLWPMFPVGDTTMLPPRPDVLRRICAGFHQHGGRRNAGTAVHPPSATQVSRPPAPDVRR